MLTKQRRHRYFVLAVCLPGHRRPASKDGTAEENGYEVDRRDGLPRQTNQEDTPVIVLHDEDDRELGERRYVHSLIQLAHVRRTVSKETDCDLQTFSTTTPHSRVPSEH